MVTYNHGSSMYRLFRPAPIFMKNKNEGAHEWMIEFKKNPKNIEEFTFLLDKELKKQK